MLRGPSGAGKSDLALRLIDAGGGNPPGALGGNPADILVADDQVALTPDDAGGLIAAPPAALAGLLEVRGVGILPQPFLTRCPLGLVVDLSPTPAAVPRLPEPATVTLAGVALPRIHLWSFAASAPLAVRMAVRMAAVPAARPPWPEAWDHIHPAAHIPAGGNPMGERRQ